MTFYVKLILKYFGQPIIQRNISKGSIRKQINVPINVQLQVLSRNTHLNVCYSQVKTSGNKNNFLRVYYADIVTPILGDHLYSSRVKSVGGHMTALNPLSVRVGAENQVIQHVQLLSFIILSFNDFYYSYFLGNFHFGLNRNSQGK